MQDKLTIQTEKIINETLTRTIKYINSSQFLHSVPAF
jgi:hypothetical protein